MCLHSKNPLENQQSSASIAQQVFNKTPISHANISKDLRDPIPVCNSAPTLAVVVPCYNEEAVLPDTHTKLSAKLMALMDSGHIGAQSFLCYVDDGSRDKTWEMLEVYAKSPESSQNFTPDSVPPPPHSSSQDRHLKIHALKLSRNVGHQNALLAGLEFVSARCDCAISIDADLQDDIGVFDEFIAKFIAGCEVVYGVRKSRASDTAFKRSTAVAFYDVMELLGVKIVHNHADYRLLSARAIHALFAFKEVNLFLRGIVPLLGFQSAVVEYDRLERQAGESKYPLRKMLSFAWNGITSFSIMPLRVVSVLGFLFFFLSLILGGYVLFVRIFTDWAVYGWASTLVPLSFFSGIQLLSLGMIGEYIGKIYQETKARPRYFVQQIV